MRDEMRCVDGWVHGGWRHGGWGHGWVDARDGKEIARQMRCLNVQIIDCEWRCGAACSGRAECTNKEKILKVYWL